MNPLARPPWSHRRAVALMLLVTLMWSIAGVVTKRLDAAASFEVTFWRSAATVLSLTALLVWHQGAQRLRRDLFSGGWPQAVSAVCWAVMFTAFMVALTLTTVANVLLTLALGPLFTALLAAATLGHRLPLRTWVAIAVAGAGIAWMVHEPGALGGQKAWLGMLVALAVPIAGAVNWTLLQAHRRHAAASDDSGPNFLASIWWGALISTVLTLPMAWPLHATTTDVAWLSMLGLVQLAIPCMLAVQVSRVLSGPEVSLLALLEVVFGMTWAWLGAGERPSAAVLGGGALVLGALAFNEWLGLRESRQA